MKKILGLDLGVASIGWAFIKEDDKKSEILGMGVRIIPLNSDERDEFNSGNAISKNAKRRMKRGMRRNVYRRTLRKSLLKNALKEVGIDPGKELFEGMSKLSLWELRSKAVHEQISLDELGRVLYHLNQKRGFKSNRKTDGAEEDPKKESEYKAEIRKNDQMLRDSNQTIGEYVYAELRQDQYFKLKGRIFPRQAYADEFNAIWKCQSKFHSNVLTEELRRRIQDEIIFHQRPLKSQKALVSRCEFEKRYAWVNGKKMDVSPRVTPKTSPLAQWTKIYEAVLNIRVKNELGQLVPLDFEKLMEVADALKHREKMSATDVFKTLGLSKNYTHNIGDKGIQGDTTFSTIEKVIKGLAESENLLNKLKDIQFDIVLKDNKDLTMVDEETGELFHYQSKVIGDGFEKSDYYRLWHLLYSVESEESLVKNLMEDFGCTQELALKLVKLDFTKPGFSNKSAAAIKKTLPYLMDGFDYTRAMMCAGYRHSDFLDKAENEARALLDKIPILQKNSLRQPVVEKVLNQLINIVNAIIEHPNYGRPDEIRVELARELKQSKDERNRSSSNISKNEKRNKEIEDRLRKDYGFVKVTKALINKFKIYEEVGGVSPYTGKRIALADFLNGAGVDVEHIIPKSRLFDDSLSNKTMAEAWVNKAKGNMTAFDFMKAQPVPGLQSFDDYIAMVNLWYKAGVNGAKITRTKYERLLCEEKKIPNDFIDRQLRQTQYISRKASQILGLVSRNVYATSGGVTDFLREKWGWNDVLKKVNWERYEKLGLTSVEKREDGKRIYQIEGWSKRDDHRHHAVDALVVACTKQSYIQSLNRLNQFVNKTNNAAGLKDADHYKLKELGELSPFKVDEIVDVVSKIIVSFKPGKRVASKSKNKSTGHISIIPRGALSKETVYGKIKVQSKREVALNKNFNQEWLVVDRFLRTVIRERIQSANGDLSKAFKLPILMADGETPVKKVEIYEWNEEAVVKYPLSSIKPKDVEFVVDPVVKQKLQAFFDAFPNEKEAIKNIGTQPIWFNEEKRIPIRTVRLKTGLGKVVPQKQVSPDEAKGFVDSGNNHHLAVYEREDGSLFDVMVSFQEAFERKANGIPLYLNEYEGGKLKWKFEQNDLFEIPNADGKVMYYRMQKVGKNAMGTPNVVFRLIFETNLEDSKENMAMNVYYNIQSLGALQKINPRAIRLNTLGEIV
jgi:CRISPR-associated endonuclease Csn1